MHQYRLRERLEHGSLSRPWHLYTLGWSLGTVFPCHWHPEWEFLLVDRGTLELTWNHELVTLGPGDAVFLTGTDLHGGSSRDPAVQVRALVLHSSVLHSERRDAATERWIEPLEAGTRRVTKVLAAGSRPAGLVRALVDAIVADAPGVELLLKGLVFQFLHEVVAAGLLEPSVESSSSDPLPRIRSILQYIEEHFADPLTAASLASRACLSPSHFTRVFRSITGDPPVEYLIRRRVQEAARLLREEALSISEVALQVGFTNFSHFSRTFRKHLGQSPSEFGSSPRLDPNSIDH